MNEEKIKEVFSDEAFVKSLMELETPEEVQNALEEKDIDLSVDEIKKIAELIEKKANGELTDEDLENVAGGSIVFLCSAVAGAISACVVAGTVYVGRQIARRRW